MVAAALLLAAAPPAFEVVNNCPPAFVVESRLPPAAAPPPRAAPADPYARAWARAAAERQAGLVVCRGVPPALAARRRAEAAARGFGFCEVPAGDTRFRPGTTTFTFATRGVPGPAAVEHADGPAPPAPPGPPPSPFPPGGFGGGGRACPT